MNRRSVWLLLAAAAWGPVPGSAQTANIDAGALAATMAHFRANARQYGLTNPDFELRVRSGRRDQLGMTHIRLDQYYNGVRVFEGEAISHVDRAGRVTVTNALRPNLSVNTLPGVAAAAAAATVLRAVGARGPHDPPSVALEILPRGSRSRLDLLVWHVKVFIENDVDATQKWDYFVDARTGAIVWAFNSLETSATTGTGKTMYAGDVPIDIDLDMGTYYLRDLVRSTGNRTVDMRNRRFGRGVLVSSPTPVFGNNKLDNSDPDTAGADAHWGLQTTWDYFKTAHARNGIDGLGTATYSRVHYRMNYENAFWSDSCFCMTYGDGATFFYPLVALDIAGHEMSHGVMNSEAALTYSGESGGLNESNSDIFGTLVEYFANNALDVPDYWIGERAIRDNWSPDGTTYTQTEALRYMDDPNKDGKSPACWSATIGNLDVHYSSGPSNHMFYLLSAGGTSKCNGQVVTSIGRTAAGAIWYRALSTYMTQSTDYHDARTACLNAAADLYGAGSPQHNAVGAAFSAINVN